MKLNNRQQEKAIALRNLLITARPEGETAWTALMDYSRALGGMLDAVDDFTTPTEIKAAFDAAWQAYIRIWGAEHERVLSEALGNDELLLTKVKEHANGQRIVNRIIQRVKDSQGGINPQVTGSSIEVTDILLEEMSDDWSEP